MVIARLCIDGNLFLVVISWDTLPVSDGANWIFSSRLHITLSGELKAVNTSVL